jgi:hypothetical protein
VAASPAKGPSGTGAVAAILELPLGDLATDFGALSRGMSYPVPLVNGYSGYTPPHYIALAEALREGEYGALQAIAPGRSLAVVVNGLSGEGARVVADLTLSSAPDRIVTEGPWTTLIVPYRPLTLPALGRRIAPVTAAASEQAQDVGRMLDGRVESAWGSGSDQQGGERVTIDLGATQALGAIVMPLGAYAFGFPRRLTIEVSDDGVTWTAVWSGPTAGATTRAAVLDPANVPLRLDLADASGRYVRLEQNGAEAGIPWWIAELALYERP